MVRSRGRCPEILVGPEGVRGRVVVATHPSLAKRRARWASRVRAGSHELFLTNLPEPRFTASDVVEL